jgi:glycosyltransferase involved in cell wall biosynthesis
LFEFFQQRNHEVNVVSDLRARWIFWKPWKWPVLLKEIGRLRRWLPEWSPDVWMTYHTYYKAPDVLGPTLCRSFQIPYFIFQGIYSTRRKKDWRTWPGYALNRYALARAQHVFSNRREDHKNLARVVPENRLSYVRPGIHPEQFVYSESARERLRSQWGVGQTPVIISAAMFRPGVKTRGLSVVLRACGKLLNKGASFFLVIAGDGRQKALLQALAQRSVPGRVRFVGKIPRDRMAEIYSAGDMFAFPGIRESLGMVYLEAQSCGIPVVAFLNGGIPEVVRDGKTGFLVPMHDIDRFTSAMELLLRNPTLRNTMGETAARYVREHHRLVENYHIVEARLAQRRGPKT